MGGYKEEARRERRASQCTTHTYFSLHAKARQAREGKGKGQGPGKGKAKGIRELGKEGLHQQDATLELENAAPLLIA